MFQLRASGHPLPLMSHPTLSEVSVQRARPLAGSAPPGTSAHPLCACCLHAAGPIGSTGVTEQTRGLQPLIPRQRRDAVGRCPRPAASRRRDRFLQRAAHLESTIAAEPSLMMPGIIISFVFSEQTMLIVCTAPV